MAVVVRSLCHPRLRCDDVSLTRQEYLKDSLIGSILERFKLTGILDQPNAGRTPVQGDVIPDFTEQCNNLTIQRESGAMDAEVSNETNKDSYDSEQRSEGTVSSPESKDGAEGAEGAEGNKL